MPSRNLITTGWTTTTKVGRRSEVFISKRRQHCRRPFPLSQRGFTFETIIRRTSALPSRSSTCHPSATPRPSSSPSPMWTRLSSTCERHQKRDSCSVNRTAVPAHYRFVDENCSATHYSPCIPEDVSVRASLPSNLLRSSTSMQTNALREVAFLALLLTAVVLEISSNASFGTPATR